MPPIIETNETAYAALTQKITRERGFHCPSYKDKCLRRRIAVRMRAKGAYTFAEYGEMLDVDPREYDRLIRALTINVTRFFRNREAYDCLARKAIPELWALPAEQLTVWSAGCSSGEEPLSVAVLFHQHAESLGELGRLGRVRIIGTDIDEECLMTAGRGVYAESSFIETPLHIRERYFPRSPAGVLRAVVPEVKQLVSFERTDVLQDSPPGTAFNLVLCRNVIIYFEREAQDRLYERVYEALAPGGFMMLGKVETLLGEARSRFAPVSAKERIFRRQ